MQKIILKNTIVNGYRVEFDYDYPEEWGDFIVDPTEKLFAEYDFLLHDIPKSILNILFVSNVMLLAMFHNGVIILDELDKSFYDSIPNILNGYRELYPDRNINITINCSDIKSYQLKKTNKKIVAFTGGVDATSAVASHINEDLIIANIWGGDIKLDNPIRHNAHVKYFEQFAKEHRYCFHSVSSNFRFIYDDRYIPDHFNHDWWCAIGHSVLIPVFLIPLACKYKANIYLASTYTKKEYSENIIHDCNYYGIVNSIRFSNLKTIQCDENISRSEKIINIISAFNPKKTGEIQLLSCWNHKKNSIVNCCNCEKCYRTIMDIKSNQFDPELLGYNVDDDIYKRIKVYLSTKNDLPCDMWRDIQNKFLENKKIWKKDKQVGWILKIKINEPSKNNKLLYPVYKRFYWKLREIGGRAKRKVFR